MERQGLNCQLNNSFVVCHVSKGNEANFPSLKISFMDHMITYIIDSSVLLEHVFVSTSVGKSI